VRFIPALILAYLALGLQSGLAQHIQIRDASPNLVLPAVIFIALYASRDSALLGSYILGLMQDMLSMVPLGVNPLIYAAITAAVRMTQPAIHREHWLTHVLLGLAGGVLQGVILTIVGLRMPPRPEVEMLVVSTLYTAALCPLLLKPLLMSRRIFGFQPERKLPGRV
jgi:rod shape-determining protein MreD